MQSIELFTGAGGLALGSHLAGFHHEALIEWDQDACKTLRRNASAEALPGIGKWKVYEGDIRLYAFDRFAPVDMIAGGVPCQPFSLGGKHKGQDDSRNMFPEFVRAVRELQPRAFIVENVKGLLRQTFRSYFEYILLQLAYPTVPPKRQERWADHLRRLEDIHTKGRFSGLRYNVVFQLLNAADYGVPQTRERVFIVGFREDLAIDWHFPKPTHSYDALMWEQQVTGDYWDRHGVRPPRIMDAIRVPFDVAKLEHEEAFQTSPWKTVRDAISDLPPPSANRDSANVANHKLNLGAKAYPGHTGSPLDLPAKTLKAGVHGVPGGENMLAYPDGKLRYFTVREAARLQTFPDSWLFEGAWSEAMRQLGNAVPVQLASVVAESVATRLRAEHG